jgi:hypothetical protein
MANFIDQDMLQQLLSALPPGHVALGIDENTALVRVDPPGEQADTKVCWQVMGLQTVKVFEHGAVPRILRVGETVLL